MKNSLKKRDVNLLHVKRCEFKTRFFLFKIRPSGQKKTRIAFAFSKKVGVAVLRNRFKRRLRALFRQGVSIPRLSGFDILCIAKGPLKALSQEVWQKEKNQIQKWWECVS